MTSEGAEPTLTRARLEALYLRLEKPVYNVVYRWLWDAAESRDLVQETFLRLWRMRDRVRLPTVEALAYRIALNLASNRRRARRLRRAVTLEALRAGSEPSDPAASPDQPLDSSERREAVRRAIEALPERLRRVIALCELADMTYEQAGEVLGIPSGTVGSRRHAALKVLRERLAEHGAGSAGVSPARGAARRSTSRGRRTRGRE